MQRDLELLKSILLEVEKSDGKSPLNGKQLAERTAADERTVNYHLKLLVEAGWIETLGKPHYTSRTSDAVPDLVLVSSLTNDGHNFVRAVGEPSRWKKFLAWAGDKVAGASLSTLAQMAIRFATGG